MTVLMEAEMVVRILAALRDASVWVCVDGGWGVDALLGLQSRPHRDLDLIVNLAEVETACSVLAEVGLSRRPGGSPSNIVLCSRKGLEVDVHAIRFDEHGFGHFPLPGGGSWPFPPAAFRGQGTIAGESVRCLSVDAQVQCHGQGYVPSETDVSDMRRLQDRFGVVLPLSYYLDSDLVE